MRTTSSRRSVGALAPPTKLPIPLAMLVVGAGKMPAVSRAAALGLIIQAGIMLPGNCPPEVIPKGAAWPGQLANKTLAATCAFTPLHAPIVVPGPQKVGANIGFGLGDAVRRPARLPPYEAVSGTV